LLIAQDISRIVALHRKNSVLETAVDFGNPVTTDQKTRQYILDSLLGLQPAFRQLALLNASGSQVAEVSRLSSSMSPQFQAHLQGDVLDQTRAGQRFISPVYIDNLTSEPLVVMAVPAHVWQFQGFLVAELNLKFKGTRQISLK
jgi:hypothetical protein